MRKVETVKGMKPLHYSKRDVELLSVGDKAWISFNAKRAIPVVIVDAHENGYSVRSELTIGRFADRGQWGLFSDEVRSTPEKACLNCVTL